MTSNVDYANFYKAIKTKEGKKSMNRIVTLETRELGESLIDGGCGECQTSCQSACKTSCGVANQQCENAEGVE